MTNRLQHTFSTDLLTPSNPTAGASQPPSPPSSSPATSGTQQPAASGTQESAPRPALSAPVEPRTLLHIESDPSGGLVLTGEIDASNAAELRAALDEASPRRPHLVADLRGLTYLDSAGLYVLFDRKYEHLRLRINPGSAVASVIGITGLAQVLHVDLS